MKPRGKPFEKGADARRNARGQRNKAAVAFSKTLRELIVAEGEKSLTLQDGKRIKKVNAMVRQLWAAAIQGEAWAVQYISERVEGKVKDEHDHTIHGELDFGCIDIVVHGDDSPIPAAAENGTAT